MTDSFINNILLYKFKYSTFQSFYMDKAVKQERNQQKMASAFSISFKKYPKKIDLVLKYMCYFIKDK